MGGEERTIRGADPRDAAGIQAIYAPIVESTVISFEEAVPTVDDMATRIAATLATHPYLVAERDGRIVGYAYAGRHNERAAYAGPSTSRSTSRRTPGAAGSDGRSTARCWPTSRNGAFTRPSPG